MPRIPNMPRISVEFKLKAVKAWFHIGGALTPKLAARIAYGAFFTRPFKHKPLPSDLPLIRESEVINLKFEHKNIRGYSWGNSDQVVLLAHGWSSHALTMRKFVLPLVHQGFSVIAFDAPAHGNSEGTHASGMQYRRFLHQVFVSYKPKVVIAHSLGGICTLAELAITPEVKVEKVVTIAAPITSTIIIQQFLSTAKLHRHAYPHFDAFVERKLGIDHNQFDLAQVYPHGIPYEGMIVHDSRDNLIPFTESIKLANIWPQAKVLTTHGLDHSGVIKDSEVIDAIVHLVT